MKKLIMAAVIVCAAAFAQASLVNWGLNSGDKLDATTFKTGKAYLICIDAIAKPGAFATDEAAQAWFKDNGASLADKALFSGNVADGAAYFSEQYDVAVGRKNYWLAIVNEDASALAISTSTKAINITTSQMTVPGTWSAATAVKSYGLSVPEPTSGLLLLLGMAGLALKRKRA